MAYFLWLWWHSAEVERTDVDFQHAEETWSWSSEAETKANNKTLSNDTNTRTFINKILKN